MKGDTGSLTLLTGKQTKIPTGVSNYLYLFDASGLLLIKLIRNNSVVEQHVAGRLTLLPEKNFDTVEIENVSGASNTFRVIYGPGKYEPPADRSEVTVNDEDPVRIQVISGGFTVDTVVEPSNVVGVGSDVSIGAAATLIAAADVTRKELIIEVDIDATDPIRIGDASVTAATGLKVAPGSTMVLAQAGAVYGIRTGATNVPVSWYAGKRV